MDSFNCVLFPLPNNFLPNNLSKKNKRVDQFISRIKTDTFFLQNEINVYKTLKKIEDTDTNTFFYIFETIEHIHYNEINEKFPTLEYSTTVKHTNTYLVTYVDKKFYSISEVLSNCSNNIQCVRFLMNSYKKLLQCIDILLTNSIVHNNISLSSIGVDENKDCFLFKFDLSMMTKKINVNVAYVSKYFFTYNPTYYYWALEVHALSYLISNKLSTFTLLHIETLLEDVIKNNKLLSKFGNNIKTSYENEGKKYLCKFINKPLEYIVSEIMQCSTTWDNYRLSIVYLEILIKYFDVSNKFIQRFIKILLINTHFNPLLRNDILKTINIFDEMCYNTRITDFKSVKVYY